jgi:hypothetical protein
MIESRERTRLVLTGNPGIGKSFFGLFLIAKLRERFGESVVIVYQNALAKRRYLLKGNGQAFVAWWEHSFEQELDDPNTWCESLAFCLIKRITQTLTFLLLCFLTSAVDYLLAHVGHRFIVDGAGAVARKARTIVLASPKRSNLHEFQKLEKCVTRYMPVWTFDEMESLRNLNFTDITFEDMEARFETYGGIPRVVLEKANEISEDFFRQIVNITDLTRLVSLIGRDIPAESDISHSIAHVVTMEPFKDFEVKFGSKHIANVVYRQLETTQAADLLRFISFEHRSEFAGLRGQLFEVHAHNVLQRGGTFAIKRISIGVGSGAIHLSIQSNVQCETKPFDVVDVDKDNGKYILPRARNAASVDAWMPPGTLFQMTVSRSHPVRAVGLERIIEKNSSSEAVRLYFVVPEDIFDSFTSQRYVNTNGNDRTRLGKLIIVEQYVLKLPTSFNVGTSDDPTGAGMASGERAKRHRE